MISNACSPLNNTHSHVGRWYEERPWSERVDMASRMTLFNLVRRVDMLYSEFISHQWKPRALQVR